MSDYTILERSFLPLDMYIARNGEKMVQNPPLHESCFLDTERILPLLICVIFLLCREIFCIVFRPYSAQLLLKEVEERSMWGEDGLIGLEGLRRFSERKNGNSGSSLACFCN